MIGSTGKTPCHKLTEQERRQALEAMLSERHERRIRRAEQKEDGAGGIKDKKKKKRTRKKAAKHTTASMEITESKDTTGAVKSAEIVATAEVKKATVAEETAETKQTTDQQGEGALRRWWLTLLQTLSSQLRAVGIDACPDIWSFDSCPSYQRG